MILYGLMRRVMFRLDPEMAHRVALISLRALARMGLAGVRRGLTMHRPELLPPEPSPSEVMGLRFPNPVGLAAGMDKDGDYIDALGALGFGFLELGTITPRPQPGNPKPRLFRIPEAQALINRMGFNNRGVNHLVRRLQSTRFRGVIGINIGKNYDTPVEKAVDDYLSCLREVYPYAGYVAANLSSPNTPGLRSLQYGAALEGLAAALKAEQARLADSHGRYVPLAIKLAPDLSDEDIADIAECARRHRLDGLIAVNTTVSRQGVQGLPHADEAGGLSGRPLLSRANHVLHELHRVLQGEIPLIGVGGIMSGADAISKLQAGARLVQVYTGLVYRGPELIPEIRRALAADSEPISCRPKHPP